MRNAKIHQSIDQKSECKEKNDVSQRKQKTKTKVTLVNLMSPSLFSLSLILSWSMFHSLCLSSLYIFPYDKTSDLRAKQNRIFAQAQIHLSTLTLHLLGL